MNMKKRITALLLMVVMIFGTMPALAAQIASAGNMNLAVSGTFEGTSEAYLGPLTVAVTLENGSIVDMELVDYTDTIGIMLPTFAIKSERIISNQSFMVDVVSSATVTSLAIRLAAQRAIEEAGMDTGTFMTPVQRPPVNRPAVENVDVVIVGAGMAGLSAAIELAYTYPDISFIVLEKTDLITGQVQTFGVTGAAMNVPSVYPSLVAQTPDMAFTIDGLIEDIERTSVRGPINRTLLRNVYEGSYDLFTRFHSWGGFEFEVPFFFADTGGNTQTLAKTGGGFALQTFFTNAIENLNIDLRTASRATGLLVNNAGAVYGVTVEDRDGTYAIHANAVLLATGGFAYNDALVAELTPAFTQPGAWARVMPGTTGDGFIWTRELFNTPIVGCGVIQPAFRASNRSHTPIDAPIFSTDGVRFANEAAPMSVINAMYEQGIRAYRITNREITPPISNFQRRYDAGDIMLHDTLYELAQARGINYEALRNSVDEWNAAVDAGVSPGFGLPPAHPMAGRRIDTAPFLSERARPSHQGTQTGILIDDYKRVLDGSRNIVPGLYAAGELTLGNVVNTINPGFAAGTALSYAVYGGTFVAGVMANDLGGTPTANVMAAELGGVPAAAAAAATDGVNLIVDGQAVTLPADSRPFNIDGQTHLPLAYLAQVMGFNVAWDANTSTVALTTSDMSATAQAAASAATPPVQVDNCPILPTATATFNPGTYRVIVPTISCDDSDSVWNTSRTTDPDTLANAAVFSIGVPMVLYVTFSANQIVDIDIAFHGESTSPMTAWLQRNYPMIPDQILVRQSTMEVCMPTGATITRNAILRGVNEAIVEAGVDPRNLVPQIPTAPLAGDLFMPGFYVYYLPGGTYNIWGQPIDWAVDGGDEGHRALSRPATEAEFNAGRTAPPLTGTDLLWHGNDENRVLVMQSLLSGEHGAIRVPGADPIVGTFSGMFFHVSVGRNTFFQFEHVNGDGMSPSNGSTLGGVLPAYSTVLLNGRSSGESMGTGANPNANPPVFHPIPAAPAAVQGWGGDPRYGRAAGHNWWVQQAHLMANEQQSILGITPDTTSGAISSGMAVRIGLERVLSFAAGGELPYLPILDENPFFMAATVAQMTTPRTDESILVLSPGRTNALPVPGFPGMYINIGTCRHIIRVIHPTILPRNYANINHGNPGQPFVSAARWTADEIEENMLPGTITLEQFNTFTEGIINVYRQVGPNGGRQLSTLVMGNSLDVYVPDPAREDYSVPATFTIEPIPGYEEFSQAVLDVVKTLIASRATNGMDQSHRLGFWGEGSPGALPPGTSPTQIAVPPPRS